ncbi:MAG TPA: phosphopantothenoylcysteine decarboxylase, partial [Acidiferrobacteraceae bacterium]|nr:phosphopantothenoylcysteine decarboxylase [Acidiferrobacteraceae bacterium]
VDLVRVGSAQEMLEAAQAALPAAVFVGAAAVADYRPQEVAPTKIKKGANEWTVTFVRNPDIVAQIAAHTPRPYMVGFAAETEDLIRHGRQKLVAKHLDLVAANLIGQPGSGLEEETNALTLIDHRGEQSLPRAAKPVLAEQLVSEILRRWKPQTGS